MSLVLVTFGIISFIICGRVSSLPEQNQWTAVLKSVRCLNVCARVSASVGCDGRGTLHVSALSEHSRLIKIGSLTSPLWNQLLPIEVLHCGNGEFRIFFCENSGILSFPLVPQNGCRRC